MTPEAAADEMLRRKAPWKFRLLDYLEGWPVIVCEGIVLFLALGFCIFWDIRSCSGT